MITITKINEKQMVINIDLIECIEASPDTIITMTTGRKFIVKESVKDIEEKIKKYKKEIFSR